MTPDEIKLKLIETKAASALLESLKIEIEQNKKAICEALGWPTPGKIEAEAHAAWETMKHDVPREDGTKLTASLQRGRTAQVSQANLFLALRENGISEERAEKIIAKATTESLFLALHIR